MLLFVLRRLVRFVPVLLTVALVLFVLSQLLPGNSAEDVLREADLDPRQSIDDDKVWASYEAEAKRILLDKASFYLSISPAARDERIRSLLRPGQRDWYEHWLQKGVSFERIAKMDQLMSDLLSSCSGSDCVEISADRYFEEIDVLQRRLDVVKGTSVLRTAMSEELQSWSSSELRLWSLRPVLRWHGVDNRFHHWASHLIRGQQRSQRDGSLVWPKVYRSLGWTLTLMIPAFVLSTFLAIFLAVVLVWKRSSTAAWIGEMTLQFLYTIPMFWAGTMAVVFLTSDQYGSFWHWFPLAGFFEESISSGFWSIWQLNFHRMVLPYCLLILLSVSYLTTQLKASIIEELGNNYVLTARSYGLSDLQVIWQEALPNALFPFIAITARRLIALFGGSLIVEVIFGLPGMGKLLFDSTVGRDWNVVFCICMLMALVSLVSYLLADLAYRWIDPKLSWT